MADFTVRVELHQATYQDYETLHSAMQRVGFSRHITSDEPKVYQLPTAEYVKSGSFTRGEILNQAKGAADSTGKNSGVLVTESKGCTWIGLQQVSRSAY